MSTSNANPSLWPFAIFLGSAALIVATALNGPLLDFSAMDPGDIAAWAQFFGTMGAIWYAWRQAGKDGRAREAEARATADAQARQSVINYQIAEDLFRTIVEQHYRAAIAVHKNKANDYFGGQTIDYIDSSIKLLDELMKSSLPGKDSAIDVQQMRHYAFVSRARFL